MLTHRQLLKEVWEPLHTEDAQYLRIYIRQLRNKLEANPATFFSILKFTPSLSPFTSTETVTDASIVFSLLAPLLNGWQVFRIAEERKANGKHYRER